MWMSWFCPADLLAPCSGTNGAFICFYDETHFCGCLMWVVTCGGSFSTFHIFQDPSLFSFSQETVAFQFARHPIFPILSCQVGHFSDSRYSERPGKAIVLPECFFGQLTAIKNFKHPPMGCDTRLQCARQIPTKQQPQHILETASGWLHSGCSAGVIAGDWCCFLHPTTNGTWKFMEIRHHSTVYIYNIYIYI